MSATVDPFHTLHDTLVTLQHVARELKTYSAPDIARLIKAKMKAKGEPTALRHLYELEEMIRGLRVALEEAKEQSVAPC
jgi:hypothetical protein